MRGYFVPILFQDFSSRLLVSLASLDQALARLSYGHYHISYTSPTNKCPQFFSSLPKNTPSQESVVRTGATHFVRVCLRERGERRYSCLLTYQMIHKEGNHKISTTPYAHTDTHNSYIQFTYHIPYKIQ